MRLVWATGGSHLLLSIYYNHLQSTNHYIPWPLDTWGLSGRHGGLTSFFYLLLSSPINKSLYSQPLGNLRPVWATRGSQLLLLSIIIISNQETIIFPVPWQYEACLGDTGGSLLLLISIIIISNQQILIFPAPGNMRPFWATRGSHLLLLSIIIISNQEIIIFPAPW